MALQFTGNRNAKMSSVVAIDWDNVVDKPDVVLYEPQDLTDAQKERARDNINSQRRHALHLADYCNDLSTAGVDITTGLIAAIAALPSDGGDIILPCTPSSTAYWTISSTITLGDAASDGSVASTRRAIRILGAGSGGLYGTRGSYLRWSGAAGGTFFQIKGPIENVEISGLNINGNNSAAILLDIGAMRFSRLRDIFGSGFTEKGVKLYGLPTVGALNVMLDIDNIYLNSNQSNAIAFDLDGVLASSTDTWLSTVSNSRFESTGTNGVAIRCGFSDNIFWSQIHAIGATPRLLSVTGDTTNGSPTILNVSPTTSIAAGAYVTGSGIPAGTKVSAIVGTTVTLTNNATATASGVALTVVAGCGVLFDASTSGSSGNSFPTGHLFVKSAILNTHVIEDATHTIGVNNFIDFGTTDLEDVPTHASLRGVTDQGEVFNGWGSGLKTLGSPATIQDSGPSNLTISDVSGSGAALFVGANAGTPGGLIYTTTNTPLYIGANAGPTSSLRINTDHTVSHLETTDATSDTAGSFKLAGGLAVAKKIWAGLGLVLSGSSSGSATILAPATGGGTNTLPSGTTTLVGTDTTQTLTNKSIVATQLTGTIDNARTGAYSGAITKAAGSGVTSFTATAWTAYVPTLTFNGGTIGTGYTITGRWQQVGKNTFFAITLVTGASGVTTPGSSITVTLPTNPLSAGAAAGLNGTTGTSLAALITAGTTNMTVWTYNAAFPIANNQTIYINGVYEAQ